ncbi:hypothetical protein [Streptomyces sp. NPDC059874]|uniref:hypothetical protein n=1 Tax=Streptomyces sp. NPDC059874 TaxID=3346983 RepID=UPI003647DC0D
MTTPPPNPYSGAPVLPNPYAGAHPTQNPYAQPPAPGHPPMPQHQQYAAPYPHPHAQAPAPGCRNCGAPEAANIAVRAHVGVLIMMRFHTLKGPFCRQCGRSLVRTMTTKTLFQGWWSPLSLVVFTPFTLLWNLIASIKFGKLPPSEPAPGRQPLDEGPPVYARPLAYVAIVPLLWATWVVANVIADLTA